MDPLEEKPYRVMWSYIGPDDSRLTHEDFELKSVAERKYKSQGPLRGTDYILMNAKLLVLKDQNNWKLGYKIVKKKYVKHIRDVLRA